MKIQLRLDKGIMKALSIHHQWNSGSIHDYWILMQDCRAKTMHDDLQSTPDNSNLQGKSKKVRVIGSLSYRELEENSRK